MAKQTNDERAVGVLLWMTRDADPHVRKGGIYGLPGLLHIEGVMPALRALETEDPDCDVRLAAAIVLNGFGS